MTPSQDHGGTPRRARLRRKERGTGVVVAAATSATILVAANLAGGYATSMALLVSPDGPWDHDVLAGIMAASFVAAFLSAGTALLTIIPVTLRWLGKWWFAIPAALFFAAVTRATHIALAYPG